MHSKPRSTFRPLGTLSRTIVPLLVLAASSAVGCAQQSPPGDEASTKADNSVLAASTPVTSFKKAVAATNAAYLAEVNSPSPSWSKIAQMYTSDAVMLYPMADIIVGRKAIEESYAATGSDVTDVVLQTLSLQSDGNLGYEIGSFTDKITDLHGKKVPIAGTYLTIWKLEGDGVWRMAASMSMNTTEAPEFSGSNPGGPGFQRRTAPLGGDSGPNIDEVRAAVVSRNKEYSKIINASDPKAISAMVKSLYSPEVALLLPTAEPISGTAAVGDFLQNTLGVVSSLDMTTLRVETSSRFAYEVGSLANVTMDLDKGVPMDVQGYYLTVWENTAAGAGTSLRIIAGSDTNTTTCPPFNPFPF